MNHLGIRIMIRILEIITGEATLKQYGGTRLSGIHIMDSSANHEPLVPTEEGERELLSHHRQRNKGGGGCLFKGRYPLPNYRPCMLFGAACPSVFFFYLPQFLRVIDHRPQKSNIINTKSSTTVIQGLPHSFLHKECHVFNKIVGIQT